MTENYPEVITPVPAWDGSTAAPTGYSQPVSHSSDKGTADVAKEQAADLKSGAVEAGQHVAGTAKEQASNVTAEAGKQAKDLLVQAQGELSTQAGQQQQRLASGLHALADELSAMVHHSQQKGVASDLAQQASERSHQAASWLDDRDPAHLLEDVRSFARQRPGAFLALAAGVGLVAGRLTRGLKAASSEDDSSVKAVSAHPTYQASSYSTPVYSGVTPTGGYAQDTTLASDRPFASSQDAVAGDYPIPADTQAPAWSDQSSR